MIRNEKVEHPCLEIWIASSVWVDGTKEVMKGNINTLKTQNLYFGFDRIGR